LEGSPQLIDDGLRYLREEILPTGKDDPGFKGLIALGDRNSGKALSITLWESEAFFATGRRAEGNAQRDLLRFPGNGVREPLRTGPPVAVEVSRVG
jgi:hypothetical protein